jgi:hypothetical protein
MEKMVRVCNEAIETELNERSDDHIVNSTVMINAAMRCLGSIMQLVETLSQDFPRESIVAYAYGTS